MAGKLADDQGIPHISTGDIFRAAINNETDLGKRVKDILSSGDLVPDELTIELVRERLGEDDAANGYILDGFPRTIPQAEALDDLASIDRAVNFVLEDEDIIRRLSGRRVHKPSGRTYHVEFNPPKAEGKDDVTGEDLVQRPDDKPESIKNRLEVYRKQTAPLIDYYKSKGILVDVDASPSPDTVFRSLKDTLEI
jgi:adenylate kinase